MKSVSEIRECCRSVTNRNSEIRLWRQNELLLDAIRLRSRIEMICHIDTHIICSEPNQQLRPRHSDLLLEVRPDLPLDDRCIDFGIQSHACRIVIDRRCDIVAAKCRSDAGSEYGVADRPGK